MNMTIIKLMEKIEIYLNNKINRVTIMMIIIMMILSMEINFDFESFHFKFILIY